MTEETNTNTSKAPRLIAYLVSEMPDGKKNWTPIGAAWPHGDDKGLSLKLNGEIVLRNRKPKQ